MTPETLHIQVTNVRALSNLKFLNKVDKWFSLLSNQKETIWNSELSGFTMNQKICTL